MATVLFVVTNCDKLGSSGRTTGWYLSEVAHPYHVMKNAGCEILFVSPKGGLAPMDPASECCSNDDPTCKEFLENKEVTSQLQNTTAVGSVDASKFDAVFCAGGYGAMFDFPDCEPLQKAAAAVYEKGGIVGAVCHGLAGFVKVKLSNGEFLVKGKTVTCFTDEEEEVVKMIDKEHMPFLLETKCKENGADLQTAPAFKSCVHVSDRVLTAQNPASTKLMCEKFIELLKIKQ